MIEPRELRLGNLFEEIHSKEIIEVIELTNEKVVFSGDFKGKWQARPIPLSEEWLLKFGFHQQNEMDWHSSKPTEFNIPKLRLTNFKPGEDIPMFMDNKYGTHIKTAHQLQNFFQVISGKELKIKIYKNNE